MINTSMRFGLALLFAFAVSSVGLTGCEEEGPMEEAGENIDDAADETRDELDEAGDNIEDGVDDLGD